MKKDIDFKPVNGITMAVAKEGTDESSVWQTFILNQSEFHVHNVIIVSKGYGSSNGEKQETSILRHYIENLPPQSFAAVEMLDPSVFHLFNEYWVSYYVDKNIYDKKYNFVPGSISNENLSEISFLGKQGVLHG